MGRAATLLTMIGSTLLLGCGQSTAPISVGHTANASPSVTQLRCKLPAISALDLARGDNPSGGGFVTFPGGNFTPDPRSASAGAGRPVYDPAIGDWIPKPSGDLWQSTSVVLLAPDGLSYVYETEKPGPSNPNGPSGPPLSLAVHVVNLKTGSDKVVFESGPPLLNPVGYAPPIIFMTPICFECGAGGSSLWTLDERTGAIRKISELSSYWAIADGAAWGGVTTDSYAMDRFVRVTVDGTVTSWMNLPGAGLRLLAVGSDGLPLVQVSISNAEAVWRLTEPEKGQEVFRVAQGGLSGAFSDRYGTWIGGSQSGAGAGIFLYTRGGGLQRVSDFPGVPLGACV